MTIIVTIHEFIEIRLRQDLRGIISRNIRFLSKFKMEKKLFLTRFLHIESMINIIDLAYNSDDEAKT